jgi:hypothetical protein
MQRVIERQPDDAVFIRISIAKSCSKPMFNPSQRLQVFVIRHVDVEKDSP